MCGENGFLSLTWTTCSPARHERRAREMERRTITISLDRKTMKPMRELTPEEKRAIGASFFNTASALEEARREAALIAAGKGADNEE